MSIKKCFIIFDNFVYSSGIYIIYIGVCSTCVSNGATNSLSTVSAPSNSVSKNCLFVLGLNVSLTVFQLYRHGTHMRQVMVQPHWSAPAACT